MRIVSLAPSNTEILCALGAMDDIVAVTHLCDYPFAIRDKPRIGTWISTDPERLAEFQPDLIITSYFLPEPLRSWSSPGQLLHLAPKTLADVYASILTIGEAIHRPKEAEKLVNRMKLECAVMKKKTIGKKTPKIYMEEWHKPPFVSGNWIPELVAIAGGDEGLIQPGEPSKPIELADLEALDPDVIVCHWYGAGSRINISTVPERPGWHQLRAIREGKLYSIDDSYLNRPGPRLVDALPTLYNFFHELS